MTYLEILEASALGVWIRESEWGYPIVLICHTVGMALVAGGVLVFALCALRRGASTRVAWFVLIFRCAWAGFFVSLLSGFILFAGAAQRFIAHPMFQLKLAALVVGTVLLVFLHRALLASVERKSTAPDTWARALGGASILFWFAAIAAGRLMAYVR